MAGGIRSLIHFLHATRQQLPDPRLIIRWVYIGRLSLAAAIFLAALFAWERAPIADTRAASVAFALAMVVTAASAVYSEVQKRPLGRTFLYLQAIFDLLLATAVVHLTGGQESQFAAVYILVIAGASLLLPIGSTLLIALLGCVLYFGDILVGHPGAWTFDLALALQLLVFGIVALGSAYISARLQQVSAGTAELAAELVKVRLQGTDILRNIRSGIISVDEAGRLLYANPAAASLLGLDLGDAQIGQPILRALARRAPELAQVLERTVRARTRINRGEGQIVLPDRSFPIGLTTTFAEQPGVPGAPPGAPGSIAGTAIFQDISDQKKLDSLHLRAERLEAVAELSASLAHEIKNPLAAVRSAVEQLARMPTADDDARTLSALIMRESDRLSRLLSEFLDFARVRVATTRRVDLGAVARDACDLVTAHPDKQDGVHVVCQLPPDEVIVEGDDDLLHRAVFNLALNAVQASPTSGRVAIEVESLAPDQLPQGVFFEHGAVAVRVTDDGPGIPPEIRDRLFDPFFTTKPGGSGLGLPIVHRAIEAHRGLVLVDSAEGTGTRFTVILPRAEAAAAAADPEPEHTVGRDAEAALAGAADRTGDRL